MITFGVIAGIIFINFLIMLMFRSVEPRKTFEELEMERRRSEKASAAEILLHRAH